MEQFIVMNLYSLSNQAGWYSRECAQHPSYVLKTSSVILVHSCILHAIMQL